MQVGSMFVNDSVLFPCVGLRSRPGGFEAFVQRRARYRLEKSEHHDRDAGVLEERELVLEDRRIVAVEADDHARDGHHAVTLNRLDRRDQIRRDVLHLRGFPQPGLARRFDAEKHLGDVGLPAELQKLGIAYSVDGHLGV